MLAKGIVRGRLGKAYGFIVITTFSARAVMAYLSVPIDIANKFQLL